MNPFLRRILEAAKSAAKENLLLQGNHGTKRHTKLATLVEEKFSKKVDLSKSAWLVEQLASASKSVGQILVDDGCRYGTCFLVTKDVVLTNYHVYKDIEDDIDDALHPENPKVEVSFNHVKRDQQVDLHEVEVDILAQCSDPGLDYIFLRLKDECELPGLSTENRISTDNPTKFANEVVTLIGHPDGREKRVDTDCRILSERTWRPELLKTIEQRPSLDVNSLYTCREEIFGERYKNKMAYHTSLFHGASGSPVLDDRGKLSPCTRVAGLRKLTEGRNMLWNLQSPWKQYLRIVERGI